MKRWSRVKRDDQWVHDGGAGHVQKVVVEDDGENFVSFHAHCRVGRLLGKTRSLAEAKRLVEDSI